MFIACGISESGGKVLVLDTADLTVCPVDKADMPLVRVLNYDYEKGNVLSAAALENWVGSGRRGLVVRDGERSWRLKGRRVVYEFGEGGLMVNGVVVHSGMVMSAGLNLAYDAGGSIALQFLVSGNGHIRSLCNVRVHDSGRVVPMLVG